MDYRSTLEPEDILKRIIEVVKDLLGDANLCGHLDESLTLILAESTKAIEFVTVLEDEFDIVFDDDEVDTDFFTNAAVIVNRVLTHIMKSEQTDRGNS